MNVCSIMKKRETVVDNTNKLVAPGSAVIVHFPLNYDAQDFIPRNSGNSMRFYRVK